MADPIYVVMDEPYHDNGQPIAITTSVDAAVVAYLVGRTQSHFPSDGGRVVFDENRTLYVASDDGIKAICGPMSESEFWTIEAALDAGRIIRMVTGEPAHG